MQNTLPTEESCCSTVSRNGPSLKAKRSKVVHPDHSSQLARLNRVIGQLEGVKRMIEDRRYCPEILIQTRALTSALKTIELGILETHVRNCVTDAISTNDRKKIEKKVSELMTVFGRF